MLRGEHDVTVVGRRSFAPEILVLARKRRNVDR
jgi:hypothetical protein